jgi:hypothetical protein
MQEGDQIYDYYTYIYEQYGGLKDIKEKDARKIVKKVVMTINYGLTLLGCHRYIRSTLKLLGYCNSGKEYKEN